MFANYLWFKHIWIQINKFNEYCKSKKAWISIIMCEKAKKSEYGPTSNSSTSSYNGRNLKTRVLVYNFMIRLFQRNAQNYYLTRGFEWIGDTRGVFFVENLRNWSKNDQKILKNWQKKGIGQLQTAPQGRRIGRIQKIEFYWNVQDLYFWINWKKIFGSTI